MCASTTASRSASPATRRALLCCSSVLGSSLSFQRISTTAGQAAYAYTSHRVRVIEPRNKGGAQLEVSICAKRICPPHITIPTCNTHMKQNLSPHPHIATSHVAT